MPVFLLYAVIEVAALVMAVYWLGLAGTLLLLLASAVVGMWLVRREGARAALAMADAVRGGRVAHVELTDGALIGLAGILILIPGVVSDILGLLLVLPPTRALARRWLVRAAERHSPVLRTARIRQTGPVIDGTVVEGGGFDGRVVDNRGTARPPAGGPVIDGTVIDDSAQDGRTRHEPPHPRRAAEG